MDPSALTRYRGRAPSPVLLNPAAYGLEVPAVGRHRDGRAIAPAAGGSVATFIPTIWSGALLMWLRKALVFAQPGVINRDYEGEISARGDTVKIGQIGPVTVTPYVSNQDMSDPEELDVDDQTLTITESDSFNFQVDDVDARQTGLALVGGAMERAAYALVDATDQFLAGRFVAKGTRVGALPATPGDAYDALVDLSVGLDDNLIPSQGRYAIVPPSFHGLLRKNDNFVKYESDTDTKSQALINGIIGSAAGFAILKSHNTGGHVFAGSSISATFAEQISKVEAFRMQKRFADQVRGLHVYGAKITRPEGILYLGPAGSGS